MFHLFKSSDHKLLAYILKNFTDSIITKIIVGAVNSDNPKFSFSSGQAVLIDSCTYTTQRIYKLNSPLMQDDSITMDFELESPLPSGLHEYFGN